MGFLSHLSTAPPRLRVVQGAAHCGQRLPPVGRIPHRRDQRHVHRRQAPQQLGRNAALPAELLGAKTQQLGGQTCTCVHLFGINGDIHSINGVCSVLTTYNCMVFGGHNWYKGPYFETILENLHFCETRLCGDVND